MAVVEAENRPAWPLRRIKAIHWSLLRWSAAAGVLGGLAGWALGEPLNTASASASLVHVYAGVFVYFLVVSAGIGAVLGALPGALNRSWRQVVRGGLIGLVAGGVLGGLGGLPAQYAFHALGEGLLARAAGWGIVGAAIGLCPGAATRDRRRALRGLAGGFLGGFAGGLLFNLAAAVVPQSASDTGTASRLVADLVVGLCIGLAVALVEAALKRAWLTVISGRREGAQFILSKETTAIGRDDRDDVILWGDPQLACGHARISRRKGGYVLESGGGDAATLLNGQPIAGQAALRDGDEIVLGLTRLRFQRRGAASRMTAASQPIAVVPPAAAASVSRYPGSAGTSPASAQGRRDAGASGGGASRTTVENVRIDAARQSQHPAAPLMGSVGDAGMAPAAPTLPAVTTPSIAGGRAAAPSERLVEILDRGGAGAASGQAAPRVYGLPRRAVLIVGRDAGNDVVIDDESVSARHAELQCEDGRWVVYDRGSTNGTFVSYNGTPDAERRVERNALKAGATVRFGRIMFRLECA